MRPGLTGRLPAARLVWSDVDAAVRVLGEGEVRAFSLWSGRAPHPAVDREPAVPPVATQHPHGPDLVEAGAREDDEAVALRLDHDGRAIRHAAGLRAHAGVEQRQLAAGEPLRQAVEVADVADLAGACARVSVVRVCVK